MIWFQGSEISYEYDVYRIGCMRFVDYLWFKYGLEGDIDKKVISFVQKNLKVNDTDPISMSILNLVNFLAKDLNSYLGIVFENPNSIQESVDMVKALVQKIEDFNESNNYEYFTLFSWVTDITKPNRAEMIDIYKKAGFKVMFEWHSYDGKRNCMIYLDHYIKDSIHKKFNKS
jgi:hypothetical protein